MARNEERSRETEAAILRAAMKLGLTRGVSEVTVRDICAEAGVSVGAFYHHFSSRQEVVRRVFVSFDKELDRRAAQRKTDEPPLKALINLLLYHTSFVVHEGGGAVADYYRAMLDDPNRGAVNPERSYYQAVYACVQRVADAGLLRPECDPVKTAELCISFVRGCLIDWCLHDQKYDALEHVRKGLTILLRGLTADSG